MTGYGPTAVGVRPPSHTHQGAAEYRIGLTLVRHLTALHHGSVDAQSEGVGRGSTFTLRLPLLQQVPVPTSSDLQGGPARGKARVMVVDDDVDGAMSLVMLLEMYGYAVASRRTSRAR